ncbi:hypothetical protein B7463_g9229, partial [Scytalidium lignicola]
MQQVSTGTGPTWLEDIPQASSLSPTTNTAVVTEWLTVIVISEEETSASNIATATEGLPNILRRHGSVTLDLTDGIIVWRAIRYCIPYYRITVRAHVLVGAIGTCRANILQLERRVNIAVVRETGFWKLHLDTSGALNNTLSGSEEE